VHRAARSQARPSMHGLRSSSGELELPVTERLAEVIVIVVVVRMVVCGVAALTRRIGRHSTAGLAVVAAASLVVAQLDECTGRSHPQLGSEGGVVGGPVGEEGPTRLRFLTDSGITHNYDKCGAAPPWRSSLPCWSLAGPAGWLYRQNWGADETHQPTGSGRRSEG
jgi:hypothetical protein